MAHREALHVRLTLAPNNKISGGRLLSSKTQPSANRAAGILRIAAMSLGRTETALGAFYRRLAYRVGKAKAITATARKLAILVYRTLKDGLVYPDPGAAAYDAQHRDHRCQASEAEITAALTGHYRPEHVFVLQQNLELFDAYQRQLAACDAAIEAHVQTLAAQAPAPAGALPAPRTRKKPRDNEPRFDIRTPLHQLAGVDLTQLDAIGPYSALRLLAEIGIDMSRWPTEKHFTSWLTLAPHNKISGGRLLSSKTQPSANRAAGILRMAA